MKLYTELQMREAMFELHPYADGIDKIMDSLTPIELLSDEQIEKYIQNTFYGEKKYYFKAGVEFMKEQILNQKTNNL